MRKSTPDLVKGIAVMMMVQVHLTELFALGSHAESLMGKLSLFMGGPPAAPVFMIIMGYFAMRSGKPFGMQMLRGAKLILLGLALNIMLNAHALIQIALGTLTLDPWKFIFGVDILPLAGLSIMIIALLKLAFKKHPLPYIIFLILALILSFFDGYFTVEGRASFGAAFIAGKYAWSYFPLFPWLAYPLSGCLVCLAIENKKVRTLFEKQWLRLLLLCLVVIFASSWLALPLIVNLPLYYHHTLWLYLWIMLFIMVWYGLLQKLDAVSETFWPLVYLRWVGRNVTAFYVFQWIIIGNLGTWLYHTQNGWQLAGWFAAITLVVSLLVTAWNRFLLFWNKDVVL